MSERGRSISPRADDDVEMANGDAGTKNTNAKVVIVTNLTRNVVQMHLRTIFGFYGKIVKVDLPLYAQCERLFVSFAVWLVLIPCQRDKIVEKPLWNILTQNPRIQLRLTCTEGSWMEIS